jgi:putative transposase
MRTPVLFKSNHDVVCSCKDHVLQCLKYRHPVLVDGVDTRLKEIVHQMAEELGAAIIEFELMPDHAHLLCEIGPQFGIHRLVRRLTGRSLRLLRQECPWLRSRLPTLWTNSYCMATAGGAPLTVSKRYIEQRKGQ